MSIGFIRICTIPIFLKRLAQLQIVKLHELRRHFDNPSECRHLNNLCKSQIPSSLSWVDYGWSVKIFSPRILEDYDQYGSETRLHPEILGLSSLLNPSLAFAELPFYLVN